jgi:hypothetical protein
VIGTVILLATASPSRDIGSPEQGRPNIPALIRTRVVPSTVLDTVGAPLLADVEGQRLRVHGDVGPDVVLAHAAVGQGVGVALVLGGRQGGDAGLLRADEGALRALVDAPSV